MIAIILRFFGYVKIPREAVQLSVEQEFLIEKWLKIVVDAKLNGWPEMFKVALDAQQTLTMFLRSGRL